MEMSVVIPVFNEASNIRPLHARLKTVLNDSTSSHELIFVNDGSDDDSLQVVKELGRDDPNVKYIDFSRNFGHQIAVMAGLDRSSGEVVAIIDADLQDPPELIEDMYRKMAEGYEVVYAKRRARQGDSALKRLTAKMFYRTLAMLTSVPIPVDTGDFRLIDRQVADVLLDMPEQHKFFRGQVPWIGFRQTSVEYDRQERNSGSTGYSYTKMFRLALDAITSFSDVPLRFATISGFVVSGLAFVVMLYALFSRFVLDNYVRGWTSLMVSMMFIAGIQLFSIGIIGEYIGRIATNSRGRPTYIVRDSSWPARRRTGMGDTAHARSREETGPSTKTPQEASNQ